MLLVWLVRYESAKTRQAVQGVERGAQQQGAWDRHASPLRPQAPREPPEQPAGTAAWSAAGGERWEGAGQWQPLPAAHLAQRR